METTFDRGTRIEAEEVRTERPDVSERLLRLVEQSVRANRQWVDFVYGHPHPETRPLELLAHIMLGERVWFERIAGVNGSGSTFPVLPREEVLEGFAGNAATYRRLIASHLDDIVPFRRNTGVEYQARVEDIVQHLLTHGYHHRGQLAAHFAKSGKPYPSTDHIDYLIDRRL